MQVFEVLLLWPVRGDNCIESGLTIFSWEPRQFCLEQVLNKTRCQESSVNQGSPGNGDTWSLNQSGSRQENRNSAGCYNRENWEEKMCSGSWEISENTVGAQQTHWGNRGGETRAKAGVIRAWELWAQTLQGWNSAFWRGITSLLLLEDSGAQT